MTPGHPTLAAIGPLFANPAGLWALLAVPAILAVHFLQQRSRQVVTSTWFLIENLSPDSTRGRTWDQLRASRALWLQLLAALAATWVLAEPRWLLADSAQTVVIVFDSSASMAAFRAPAIEAAQREMNSAEPLATRTTWVVMSTDARQPPWYRGGDRTAAEAAFASWQPQLGLHDPAPALRLAGALVGSSGRSLLITDTRNKVPPGQRAAGVGHPLANVGFAGATAEREEAPATGHRWRALVQNHTATPQKRTWHVDAIAAGGVASSPVQSLELAPDALVEISGRFAEGVDELMLVIEGDEFRVDDRLPLVRPAAKPLLMQVEGTDPAAEFLRKVAGGVDGGRLLTAAAPTALRLARASAAEVAAEQRGGIFLPPANARADVPIAPEAVTPDRDPLVSALNWQGWLGSGPYGFTALPLDRTLLWQGRAPLAMVRASPAGRRQLLLAFDWDTTNAARLPSTVLLLIRFLEAERDAQRAPYAANFDAGGLLPLAGVAASEPLMIEFRPLDGGAVDTHVLTEDERRTLRSPVRPGFFTLKAGAETLVRGTAQFADPRQGNFKDAETFATDFPSERLAAIERNTRADPWAPLWLLLAAGSLLGSWWVRIRRATPIGSGATA